MPIYEFVCECKCEFEALTSIDESGLYERVSCPSCGRSDRKKKLQSVFGFAFSNPVNTDRWNSDGLGHDYRLKHKLPSVLEERKRAEEKSHMGSSADIYGTQANDDLNNDAAWDPK